MEKEIELLTRVAIDHLHLTQFEAFRAVILTLRSRNPDLALSILQTIVSNGGRFSNLLYSPSCPSPPLLTWLSTLELLNFHNSTSSIWSFDPQTLRLRVEFCLYIQMLISLSNNELGLFSDVLNRILEIGLNRLKGDTTRINEFTEGKKGNLILDEGELGCLKGLIVKDSDVFDVLSDNIEKQVKGCERERDDSGLAIMVKREGEKERVELEEEENVFLGLVQRTIQRVHLDIMKESVEAEDVDGAVTHIKYLHLDYGLPEEEYRYACLL